MTPDHLDDPLWDDLWHGVIWSAFVSVSVETGGWPDSRAVKTRAYELYEAELRSKTTDSQDQPPAKGIAT